MAVTISLSTICTALLGLAVLYVTKIALVHEKRASAPLPPGPPPKPIVGNLGDLPKPEEKDWLHWLKHKKLYGPISSVTMFGQTIVIVNDWRMAYDILDKRSAKHSSRPRLTFAGEMVGWNNSFALLEYSDRLREYRKALHRVMGTKTLASRLNPVQEVETRRFLLRVLEKPDDLIQHIRKEAGAVILKVAYGYTIQPHGPDPLVDLANEAMDLFCEAIAPGRWLVDTLPILKHVPSWFPGAGFKKTGEAMRKVMIETIERPYQLVKQGMKHGLFPSSYLTNMLETSKFTAEEEHVHKWSAGAIYLGGADTTVAALSCFFLAMILNPEVQRKAQEEIDRVVGPNRLPAFEDRDNLPYVDAVVKETLRWHPIGPMGLPHMTTEDDIYEGYLIPKGAIILPNVWEFTHNPETYHEPDAFKPERYLGDKPELDPHLPLFGFGRRICPGRHMADSTMFLTIAQSLAVFNIKKKGDVKPEFLPGVVSHPKPFSFETTPRSAAHEALIRAVEVEHPWEESHAKQLENLAW
ncbi:cytochrome P450 [Aspergillus alliaceus]|uniref:Cytochrome P450 n=1 Tax=Petromyces alliaceus TaxID=209559 RepID=A0A5N7BV73_PETAA|nr:cytochrome P450 [Aspergillus alliaceus]